MNKLNDKEKWMFCEYKRCPFCKKDLSEQDANYSDYEFVTKCILCDRSFLD